MSKCFFFCLRPCLSSFGFPCYSTKRGLIVVVCRKLGVGLWGMGGNYNQWFGKRGNGLVILVEVRRPFRLGKHPILVFMGYT